MATEEDDIAPTRQQVRQGRPAAPQGGEERAAHLGLDLLGGVVLVGLGPDGATHVIDQAVQAPVALDGTGHHRLGPLPGLQVGLQGDGLHALVTQPGGRLLDIVGAVDQDQAGPLGAGPLGDSQPDALGRPGDHHHSVLKTQAVETPHAASPAAFGVNFS